MYISKLNQLTDRNEIVSFMKRFSFATIVSTIDQVPQATPLPLNVVKKQKDTDNNHLLMNQASQVPEFLVVELLSALSACRWM